MGIALVGNEKVNKQLVFFKGNNKLSKDFSYIRVEIEEEKTIQY